MWLALEDRIFSCRPDVVTLVDTKTHHEKKSSGKCSFDSVRKASCLVLARLQPLTDVMVENST